PTARAPLRYSWRRTAPASSRSGPAGIALRQRRRASRSLRSSRFRSPRRSTLRASRWPDETPAVRHEQALQASKALNGEQSDTSAVRAPRARDGTLPRGLLACRDVIAVRLAFGDRRQSVAIGR